MIDENLDTLKNEIAYKIYNSVVQRYPFAHSETEGLLPERLLEQILKNWPGSDEFKTNLDSGSIIGVSEDDSEHP